MLYIKIVKRQSSQLGGIVTGSEAQHEQIGEAKVGLKYARGCLQAEDWTGENKSDNMVAGLGKRVTGDGRGWR